MIYVSATLWLLVTAVIAEVSNMLSFCLSRHMVVCRAAQENGARANGVSILTGTTKSRFLRICSSVIPHPNGTKFTMELASTQGRPDFKL